MSEEKLSPVPRMRTIPEALREIQAADPNTAMTLHALRNAVKRGKIPVVEICSKKLLNMDDVYEFMNSSAPIQLPVPIWMHGILSGGHKK